MNRFRINYATDVEIAEKKMTLIFTVAAEKFSLAGFMLAFILSMVPLTSNAQTFWETQGHIAKITMQYPQLANNKYVTLNIDWDPGSRCMPTIGVIVTNSTTLGTYNKSQKSSENMMIKVGDRQWRETTIIAGYTGGIEAMAYAQNDLMEALRSADSVEVRIFDKSPVFSFPLSGATTAIDRAKNYCH